jgi:hypothetical protein
MSSVLAGALAVSAANANTLQTTGWMSVVTPPQPPETFSLHRGATVQNNIQTGGFAGIWNTTEAIFFWCFDLDHFFNLGSTYTNDYVETTVAAYTGDATLDLQLRQLFEEASPHVRDNRDTSAAFQLAIWNLLYDNDLSVTTNPASFWANNGSATAIAQANTWLTGLSGYTGNGWSIRVLQSTSHDPTHQSFIVGDHPPRQDVPEPSPLLLFVLALGALMSIQARRRVRSRGE